jgi:hypothetical protein
MNLVREWCVAQGRLQGWHIRPLGVIEPGELEAREGYAERSRAIFSAAQGAPAT